jgi:hypothetical protein
MLRPLLPAALPAKTLGGLFFYFLRLMKLLCPLRAMSLSEGEGHGIALYKFKDPIERRVCAD